MRGVIFIRRGTGKFHSSIRRICQLWCDSIACTISLGLKQPLAALAEQFANLTNDVWVADAHGVFHSLDGGVTWTKLSVTGSIWGSHPTSQWPEVYGATAGDQNIRIKEEDINETKKMQYGGDPVGCLGSMWLWWEQSNCQRH
jgi:hypothetical protein